MKECDFMRDDLGLYIHIPFCGKKCPYCSFYSVPYSKSGVELYCERTKELIKKYGGLYSSKNLDTIYIGGGTPSLIGTSRLSSLVRTACKSFGAEPAEVTIEVNPSSGLLLDFSELKSAGINRVSVGLQSANLDELKILGRRHTAHDAAALAEKIRGAGIDNISFDLMLCTPQQSLESLARSIDFCDKNGVSHISAYMLKIEENTEFYERRSELKLPDEDKESEMYLFMCKELECRGYGQYEISNFSKSGFESRHNLKYWNCGDYLGLGPAAHSLIDGRRFYYENSFDDYYGDKTVYESDGGYPEEYSMLRLRLADGLRNDLYRERFSRDIPREYFSRAKELASHGLAEVDGSSIRLTPEGFLLSNAVTAKILWG